MAHPVRSNSEIVDYTSCLCKRTRVLYFRLSETKPSRFRQCVRRSIPQLRFAMDGKIFRIALQRVTCPQMARSRETGINYRETCVYISSSVHVTYAEINSCCVTERTKAERQDRPNGPKPVRYFFSGSGKIRRTLFATTIAACLDEQRRREKNRKER